MKKTVIPVGKNVLLKMVPVEEQKGGFYMPDSQKQKNQKGEIIDAGFECDEDFKAGQIAIAKPDKGIELDLSEQLGEGTFKVFNVEDILVVY